METEEKLKKIYIFVIPLVYLLAACTLKIYEPPYGVWESTSPNITMYVDPTIGNKESGEGQLYDVIYIQGDGTAKKLTVIFYKNENKLNIAERQIEQNEENGVITEGVRVESYFIGTYKLRGDKLNLILVSQRMAGTDYREIVFTKTMDYDEVS